MLISPTGRDDSDSFFAIVLLPIRMYYEKNYCRVLFNPSCTNCMPSLFSLFVNSIRCNQAVMKKLGLRYNLPPCQARLIG